ncbi:MAG: cation diffusion facilitator family transporter [Candidatus Eisenbacteria bacterium]
MEAGAPTDRNDWRRIRAGYISLGVSLVLLAAKFAAFLWTGSAAVLSDALESILNVFAAGVALFAIRLAQKPRDRNHPYGHGKIEFVSAAFEGGLISFAAVLIGYAAVRTFWVGPDIREIDLGLAIVLGAGVANAALGFYLLYAGRRYSSLALEADGKHVLTDFWTSAAVVVALGLVKLTGKEWIDPLCALLISFQLMRTGIGLLRQALGPLLDEEDDAAVRTLVDEFESHLTPGIINVHSVRIIRSGRFHHVDAHVVVPEFWDIHTAHARAEKYEREVMRSFGPDGEIEFHIEPCERLYCERCSWEPCPVRVEAFRERRPLSVEEAVRPDPQFPGHYDGSNSITV